MGKVLITEQHLQDIADAIRSKSSSEETYTPGEMAGAIMEIETGITPTGTKQIAANGTHDVTQYASADVQVPNTYVAADEGKVVSNGALVAQTGTSITQNGTYDTTENDEVTVNVSGGGYPEPTGSMNITQNGTYDVKDVASAVVNVPSNNTVFYSNDGTLAVEIDQINKRLTWYFNGFTKAASDVAIPAEIFISQSGLLYSIAFDSDKTTQIGQIGFYNGKIRSWTISTTQTLAGTFWGVVYSDGGQNQTHPYTNPPA